MNVLPRTGETVRFILFVDLFVELLLLISKEDCVFEKADIPGFHGRSVEVGSDKPFLRREHALLVMPLLYDDESVFLFC